jgi:hypothetical protein
MSKKKNENELPDYAKDMKFSQKSVDKLKADKNKVIEEIDYRTKLRKELEADANNAQHLKEVKEQQEIIDAAIALKGDIINSVVDPDFVEPTFDEKMAINKEVEESQINSIDFVSIAKLEKVMFYDDLRKQRDYDLKHGVENHKSVLKETGANAFAKRSSIDKVKKELNNDLYSIEKDLYKLYEQKTNQLDDLKKSAKNLKDHTPEGLKNLTETIKVLSIELEGGVEIFIEKKMYEEDIFAKYQEKFEESAKRTADYINQNSNKNIEHDKLRKADGTKAAFSKRYPEVKEELERDFSKAKAKTPEEKKEKSVLKSVLKGLSTASLFFNPVMGGAIRLVTMAAKTKVMQKFKKDMLNQVSDGLDAVGVKKGTKLRSVLKVAAATIGGIGALGAAAMYAGDLDMEAAIEITKAAGNNFTQATGELLGNVDVQSISDKVMFAKETLENSDNLAQLALDNNVQSQELISKLTTDLPTGDNLSVEQDVLDVKSNDFVISQEKIDGFAKAAYESTGFLNAADEMKAAAEAAITISTDTVAETAQSSDILNALEGAPAIEVPEMTSYDIVKGDSLSAIMETIDSSEFDLQGESLNQAVALIAEMNGITDPNAIISGSSIQIPANTEALKALMEQNADRLADLDLSFASVDFTPPAIPVDVPEMEMPNTEEIVNTEIPPVPLTVEQELLTRAIESASSPEVYSQMVSETMVNNSDNLTEALKDFKNPEVLEQQIQEKMQANIQSQIEKGTFPVAIQLDLSVEGEGVINEVKFSTDELNAMYQTSVEQQQQKINELSVALSETYSNSPVVAGMEMPNNGQNLDSTINDRVDSGRKLKI